MKLSRIQRFLHRRLIDDRINDIMDRAVKDCELLERYKQRMLKTGEV